MGECMSRHSRVPRVTQALLIPCPARPPHQRTLQLLVKRLAFLVLQQADVVSKGTAEWETMRPRRMIL